MERVEQDAESVDEYGVDFLWNRYRTLQHHLERTYAFPGAELKAERRHEHFLRELIDNRDFSLAGTYTRQMAEFCESIHDSAAAQRYRQYMDRVSKLAEAEA